jgi:signal-transduction protein with cAMP-binding, CBS, and nucleotidyltransferase domain
MNSMKKKAFKLTKDEMELLGQNFEILSFERSCKLVYEHHIPTIGIALVEGEISIFRRSRELEKIQPGTVLGIHQLFYNVPVKAGCLIQEGSKVILLTRSDIVKCLNEKSSILVTILNRILNIKKPDLAQLKD